MNFGAFLFRFFFLVSVISTLVACQQEPEPDLLPITEPVFTPTFETTPMPATASISTATNEVSVAKSEPSKTPTSEATAETMVSPTVEEPTIAEVGSKEAEGFSAVDYGDATANTESTEPVAQPFDSEIQGFRTHSLPGWGSLEIPEDWHIIYSPTPGLLLISSKDAESVEDTSGEDALLQISQMAGPGWLPIDIIREDYLPYLQYEWELVSEPEAITINGQEAATVTYHGYEEFMEQMTIYQATDGSRTVHLLAVVGEEKWPEYEATFEKIRNSMNISPVIAGPEVAPAEDLPESYAMFVDDELGYQVGYPSEWQGVGPLPVVFAPSGTKLPDEFEFDTGMVFVYPPNYYVIGEDPGEGYTAEGQVIALWDWAGTMAIQDAMMTSELSQKQVGDSEYAAAYFVATDESRDNQPIYGFMGAVTDGEKAVKMISWFDDPQEYQEVWLNIFNSIRLTEAESLTPVPTSEPEAAATPTVTITPEREADAHAIIEWQKLDLPDAFRAIHPQDLGVEKGATAIGYNTSNGEQIIIPIENSFVFINDADTTVIFGYTFILSNSELRQAFKAKQNDLQYLETQVLSPTIIDVPDIGDVSGGYSALLPEGERRTLEEERIESVEFLIGEVAASVLLRYPEDQPPPVDVIKLAQVYAESLLNPEPRCEFLSITPVEGALFPTFAFEAAGFFPREQRIVELSGSIGDEEDPINIANSMLGQTGETSDSDGNVSETIGIGPVVTEGESMPVTNLKLTVMGGFSGCEVSEELSWPAADEISAEAVENLSDDRPQGHIAFGSDAEGSSGIQSLNLQTGEVDILTYHPFTRDWMPELSPDGDELLFRYLVT